MPIIPNALSPKYGLALCALAWVLSLVLCVPCSPGQEPGQQAGQEPGQQAGQEKEPVYELGNGVVAPRVTHQVAPEHPARGFRISGTVLIGLIVTSKGEPDAVHVIRSLEKEVDQSAVEAVKQWRFDPATKDSKPVAVKISVEIRFHDM